MGRNSIPQLLWIAIVIAFATKTTPANECALANSQIVSLVLGNCSIPPTSNVTSTAYSWGIQVTVGSPPQSACLVPSTVVNNTLLMGTDICYVNNNDPTTTIAQCVSRRGGLLSLPLGGASFVSVSENFLKPDPTWESFNPSSLTNSRNVSLSFKLTTLSNFTVPIIADAPNSNAGQLGLANSSSLLHTLYQSHQIPSMGWGLNAGSQSYAYPRSGSVVLGGYDSASIAGKPFVYPIKSGTPGAGDRICDLQVTVERLVYKIDGIDDVELISEGENAPACIEPYDNLLRLPHNTIKLFLDTIGHPNISAPDSTELFVVEPGIFYPATTPLNGTFIFTLDSGQTVEIPEHELYNPLIGLDKFGAKVVDRNTTQVSIFGVEVPKGTAVLPKVFLSQLYLAVNTQANSFSLSPVVTDLDVTPNPVSFSNQTFVCPPTSSSHTPAIIAGSVVGVILGLALFALAAWTVWRFTRRERKTPPQLEQLTNGQPPLPAGEARSGDIRRTTEPNTDPGEGGGALDRRATELSNDGAGGGGALHRRATELSTEGPPPAGQEQERPRSPGSLPKFFNPFAPVEAGSAAQEAGQPSIPLVTGRGSGDVGPSQQNDRNGLVEIPGSPKL